MQILLTQFMKKSEFLKFFIIKIYGGNAHIGTPVQATAAGKQLSCAHFLQSSLLGLIHFQRHSLRVHFPISPQLF